MKNSEKEGGEAGDQRETAGGSFGGAIILEIRKSWEERPCYPVL
jgi:hypothetical protein